MDKESAEELSSLYGLVTNVYLAPDIKTAEAAKVIENIRARPEHRAHERTIDPLPPHGNRARRKF
jgi:hypothetical protein